MAEVVVVVVVKEPLDIVALVVNNALLMVGMCKSSEFALLILCWDLSLDRKEFDGQLGVRFQTLFLG